MNATGIELEVTLRSLLDKGLLDTRVFYALSQRDILTLGELISCTEKELAQISGIGMKSINRLSAMLDGFGLSLGTSDSKKPKSTEGPSGIELEVCRDIERRQKLGIAKYKTTVLENNLPLIAWLQHAYEETLDQAVYLKRAMYELKIKEDDGK